MSYANFSAHQINLNGAKGYSNELLAIDINHDGWTDLVAVSMYYPIKNKDIPIYGMINDHHGGFVLASSSSLGSAGDTHPRMILTADFNGDGRTDIFIADHGYDGSPFPGHLNTLLLGKSGGGFTNATGRLPDVPDFSHSAGAADIDGDGDIDIFVNNLGTPASYFLLNDGTGHFTQSTDPLPVIDGVVYTGTSTLFLDVDHDGDKDLFLGTGGGSFASLLLLNDGTGHFTLSAGAMPDGLFGQYETILLDAKPLDFNGDGYTDILETETNNSPSYVGARLQVLISDGAGGLLDETSTYIHGQPKGDDWVIYSNLVDLNGDGAKDIVAESKGSHPDDFYINDGLNHFYKTPGSLTKGEHSPIEPIDVNHDGRMDLVTVMENDGQHNVLIELSKPPPAHMTGTGSADTMLGGPTANTIAGEAGKDLLSGAGGSDRLDGGDGNDTLLGGAGNDTLIGGAGKDVLDGAQGHDVFRFSTATASSIDTVTDFTGGVDHIQLAKAGFAHIGATLDAGEFVAAAGAVALDGNDHILYDTATGRLSYDPDGSGSDAAVAFAVLAGHPALAFSDFSLI